MSDVDGILQIKGLDQGRQVIGIRVHLVPVPRLTGPAVATSIMSNTTISVRGKKEHLVLKGVRRQRPAVAKDNRLSAAPVLIIYFNIRRIFFTNFDKWH